jgi:hypothetical protein
MAIASALPASHDGRGGEDPAQGYMFGQVPV